MADIVLSSEAFQELVQPLIGLTVSLPWKGYGSAIFLELGALAPLESPHQRHNEGEACIAQLPRGALRLRIAIERNQHALRPKPLENRAAVATTPEGAIDVQALRLDGQGVECFGE